MIKDENQFYKTNEESYQSYIFNEIKERKLMLPYDLEKEFEISKECAEDLFTEWYLFQNELVMKKIVNLIEYKEQLVKEYVMGIAEELDITYSFAEEIFYRLENKYIEYIKSMDYKDRVADIVSNELNISILYANKLIEFVNEEI